MSCNSRSYEQMLEKKENVKRRVQTIRFEPLDCHVNLLNVVSFLYNEAHYYLKSIQLFNDYAYWLSLPADEQTARKKKYIAVEMQHPQNLEQIWRPNYTDAFRVIKDENGEVVSKERLSKGLDKLFQPSDNYKALPAGVAQHVLMQVDKDWKSYEKGRSAYFKDKTGFTGMPKPPRYKKRGPLGVAVFTKNTIKVVDAPNTDKAYLSFPERADLPPIRFKKEKGILQEVRIRKDGNQFCCEIIYEQEKVERKIEGPERNLMMDIGIGNLITAVDDAACLSKAIAWIVSGKEIKSINHHYNSEVSQLRSKLTEGRNPKDINCPRTSKLITEITTNRNRRIHDLMHVISKAVVTHAKSHNITKVMIGHNPGWKQGVNLGVKNNQNFVQIPFMKLINQLKYKLEDIGIQLKVTEESYTSKTDHFAFELMEHIELEFRKGKRLYRGLFQSSVAGLVNADVNGAIGIGRKCNGDAWFEQFMLANMGEAPTPVRKNLWP